MLRRPHVSHSNAQGTLFTAYHSRIAQRKDQAFPVHADPVAPICFTQQCSQGPTVEAVFLFLSLPYIIPFHVKPNATIIAGPLSCVMYIVHPETGLVGTLTTCHTGMFTEN